MGGGFGGKETRSLYVSCAAAVGAYHTKKPVRMVLDREEDMMSSGTRHPFYFKYKAGVSKDGKIIAMDVQLYSNAGCTIDLSGAVMDRALFHVDNAYFIPNLRCKGHLCRTNLPSNTAFRGFGAPQGMMFTESLVNHISHTTGIHANKIRELNLYQEGQQTHYLQTVSNNTMPRLWKHLLDVSDFDKREVAVKEFNKVNRFKKRGIACVPVKFGMSFTLAFMNQAGALVHCYPDGTVLISHAGTEMGQGLHTKLIQIAAKELNVPVSQIYISETSTDKVANTSPTAASVQSDLNGMAVLDACKQINSRLQPLRDAHPDFSFQKLAQKAIFERVDLTAHGYYATPDVGYDFAKKAGKPFHYYTFGASCSEVEIDTLTGEMHVIRSDCVMDVGESLNPAIDIGQIEGAFVQGLGLTTLEEIVVDDKWTRSPGKIFTRGPGTYKIPGFKNVPLNLNIHLLPGSANPLAVHGSKGIGEPPLFMGASVYFAVREAVADARSEVGLKDFFRMNSPATCERIRMSCPDQLSSKIVPK
jgi:xanthine dehydrogenase/oxidase